MFRIVCGLGNPGSRYDATRHNIGFALVDRVVERLRGTWREKDGASECVLANGGEKLLFIKPLLFMNRSGEPLAKVATFFKVAPEEIVVVHDDIDLPFGSIRMRAGGGEGGHNGLRSIVSSLGSSDFVRLKLGVGRPQTQADGEVVDWVLREFPSTEKGELDAFLGRAEEALQALLRDGLIKAQNLYNSKKEI